MADFELSRREALAALAAAGGYALAAEPVLAQAIKTDSQGIVEGTVTVAGADGAPIPVSTPVSTRTSRSRRSRRWRRR